MIIHAEHGDSLVEPKSSREMKREEELLAIEPLTRGRKRRRTSVPSQTATPERTPSKRLKRSESDVGKDFTCEEEGCDKKFKRVSMWYILVRENLWTDVSFLIRDKRLLYIIPLRTWD
jgi:hypothetical protein